MTAPNTSRPTPKQLRYLRGLARRTGQTFTHPRTSSEASGEIRRLKALASTGFSFAELEAERQAREAHDDVPVYAAGFRDDEVAGYGSDATWKERG